MVCTVQLIRECVLHGATAAGALRRYFGENKMHAHSDSGVNTHTPAAAAVAECDLPGSVGKSLFASSVSDRKSSSAVKANWIIYA